jgi:hypothetical protein
MGLCLVYRATLLQPVTEDDSSSFDPQLLMPATPPEVITLLINDGLNYQHSPTNELQIDGLFLSIS